MSDPSSSDLPPVEPAPEQADPAFPNGTDAGPGPELEVDLAAFLPEGVELGDETVIDDGTAAAPTAPAAPPVDLEALSQIERDLDAVDAAIAALDAGTYGVDPATGQAIDDALLAENPTRLS